MNMKRKVIELETVQELKAIEKVSQDVSKKYVPIYSSAIVELMEPEYKFKQAVQALPSSSSHYVDLVSDDAALRIYNSYDRSLALRVNYYSDGMLIPLGIDRLIHMGAKAKTFTKDFTDAKEEIKKAVKTARNIDKFLSGVTITDDLKKVISKAIFRLPKNFKMVKVTNPVDVLKDISLKEYIKKSTNNFLLGNYHYEKEDGAGFKGPKKNTVMTRIKSENRVIKALKAQYPELFL